MPRALYLNTVGFCDGDFQLLTAALLHHDSAPAMVRGRTADESAAPDLS